MTSGIFGKFRRAALVLAKPEIFCFAVLWLIFLTVAGTLAQSSIGLYRAQQIYFSAFIYWIGFLPAPGGYTTLTVVFIGLVAKFLFDSPWVPARAGVLITHFGAILLLLGGFLTAVFSQEGTMVIPPGQTVAYFSDYHKLEFAVTNQSDPAQDEVTAFGQGWLKPGSHLKATSLPFDVEVLDFHRNVTLERFASGAPDADRRGFAANFNLLSAPEAKEAEQNQAGVLFRLKGAGGADGVYGVFEEMPVPQTLVVNGKKFLVEVRRARRQLPFQLNLLQFEKKVHPGTEMAKSYRSVVNLIRGGISQRAVIQMNEPLRQDGYTFYQSSFVEHPQGNTTILSVVKNAGRTFPYISSIIMCIGLLVHLLIQTPKLIRKTAAVVIIGLCGWGVFTPGTSGKAWADDTVAGQPVATETVSLDGSALGRIPILHEGRIKPLDTFARAHLLAFYGRSSFEGQSAISWLVELLMDPDRAYSRRVFNLEDPAAAEALGLERVANHRYSFLEVSKGLQSYSQTLQQIANLREEERSATQNHILDLYSRFVRYLEISRSLSPFLPEFRVSSEKVARQLGVAPGERFSFRDVITRRLKLEDFLKQQLQSKGADLADNEKREVAELFMRLDRFKQDIQPEILRIFPPQWGGAPNTQDTWLAPAALISTGMGSPATSQYLGMWKSLYEAYHGANPEQWKATSSGMLEFSRALSAPYVQGWKLDLERTYNRLDLFTYSLALYVLAFLLLATGWLLWPERLRKASLWVLGAGAVLHLTGLTMRIIIMGRPPVSTLYESIIFVGLISVGFGLYLERARRNGVGVMIGALSGTVLQFIGLKYAASGDTMGMLVAVLNTNFWLATHVLTITIGYGCCLVGGLLAHIYLIHRTIKPRDLERSEELSRNMIGVGLVALFFSLFGTILGGIWADQSWGRFWGWDPKENGALLIVLWLLFLLHARLGKLMGKLGFAAGMALTNVVVALAWFGVNLLNVGLHSYGFTQNIAMNLGLFCGAEVLLVAAGYFAVRWRGGERGAAIDPMLT